MKIAKSTTATIEFGPGDLFTLKTICKIVQEGCGPSPLAKHVCLKDTEKAKIEEFAKLIDDI